VYDVSLPAAIGKLRLGNSFTRLVCAIVVWATAIIVLMNCHALSANEIMSDSDGYVIPYLSSAESKCDDLRVLYQGDFWLATQHPDHVWTIDYRFRSLSSSFTSYEFGTPVPPPHGWSPLSRLNFDLNSLWHGVEIGFQKPLWGVHFQYFIPMQRNIQGNLNDYDWMIPGADFTDLGILKERWIDGQMLDFKVDFRIWDEPFGLPIDVWPVVGFRFQRFDLMCYDGVQVKEDNVWPPNPARYSGDIISFNQQYYIGYIGGQLRTIVNLPWLPSFDLMFEGDWGATSGYNIDHHLIREGDRYTMESTNGDSWHIALSAEVPVTRRLSVGCEAAYLQIHTSGRHRWLNEPLNTDETWDNGVSTQSDQTWLTAFVRVRI
jgi:hypothetical protein